MILATFYNSLAENRVPTGLNIYLKSLWLDAKGNWQEAHDLIDQRKDLESAHLHAYLHRKEGDLWNAEYWYKKAKKEMPKYSLQQEWEELLIYFMNKN